MTRIVPNLMVLTASSSPRLSDLPPELLALLTSYLPTPDLINFTNTSRSLRNHRTAASSGRIAHYLTSRRHNQENLRTTLHSPDHLTVGPLRDLNSSSSSGSPSPSSSYRTYSAPSSYRPPDSPSPSSYRTPVRLSQRRRNSCSLSTPVKNRLGDVTPLKTPRTTLEKKSRSRLRRL